MTFEAHPKCRGLGWALAASIACIVAIACGDPAGPRDPSLPPLPASITEWLEWEPELVQRGVFQYDASRRLTRYDFGMLQADGSHRITYYVLYKYEGERMVKTETYVRDVNAFVHVGEAEYTYDTASRVQRRVTSSLDEVTGTVQQSTTEYEYDASGRVTTLLQGDERTVFTYDDAGNVIHEEVTTPGLPVLVYQYEYGQSLNPLAALNPQSDPLLLIHRFGRGPNNIIRWTSGEAGQTPASVATIAHDLNELGLPTRAIMKVTNSSQRDVSWAFITTINYVP